MPLKLCSLISDKSRAQLLEAVIKKPQKNTKTSYVRWINKRISVVAPVALV